MPVWPSALKWCHNERNGASNLQPHYCLFSRLFKRRSKKISKLRVTGLCEGNSPETGEFTVQKASNAANVSVWWRHHEKKPNETISAEGDHEIYISRIVADRLTITSKHDDVMTRKRFLHHWTFVTNMEQWCPCYKPNHTAYQIDDLRCNVTQVA